MRTMKRRQLGAAASAMSSQRPATLTQKAILQLIQQMAPRLLV